MPRPRAIRRFGGVSGFRLLLLAYKILHTHARAQQSSMRYWSLSYVLSAASMLLPGLQGAQPKKMMLGVLCIMAGVMLGFFCPPDHEMALRVNRCHSSQE